MVPNHTCNLMYIFLHLSTILKAVCLSIHPHFSGWSDSQLWLYELTSDLLNVIAMSAGMTKFIFKSF